MSGIATQPGMFREPAGGDAYFLADHPGANLAYSLRALSATFATSDLITAKRISDSATSGFTQAEIEDGTLATWASGTDAHVITWFDQSGTDEDLSIVSGDSTNQCPMIVDNGVVETTANGVPTLRWGTTGSAQRLRAAVNYGSSGFSTTDQSFFFHAESDGSYSGYFGTDLSVWGYSGYTTFPGYFHLRVDSATANETTDRTGQEYIHGVTFSDSGATYDSELFLDASSTFSGSISDAAVTTSGKFQVGLTPLSAAYFLTGIMGEMIAYPSDKGTEQDDIADSMNSYFEVY